MFTKIATSLAKTKSQAQKKRDNNRMEERLFEGWMGWGKPEKMTGKNIRENIMMTLDQGLVQAGEKLEVMLEMREYSDGS